MERGRPRLRGRFVSKRRERKYDSIKKGIRQRWENTKIAETHSYSKIASTNVTIESDDCHSVDNVPVDLEEVEVVYTENVIDSPRLEKDWRCGRRLIELGVLADGLSACKKCGLPLQLTHCQGITNFGLSAMLKIPCMNSVCKMMNNVSTGKRHNKIWDANTKLAAAVQHTGIGFDQISGILAELNMPPISRTLLSSRQVEIGKATECIASLSMQEALEEEVMATNIKKQSSSISVSVDGAWQKRGSGRSYDSLTGHCSMMGVETGKVIDYSVRSKTCKICENAERKNTPPAPHECTRNWTGSSKSMEPDMIVEMVGRTLQKGNQGSPSGIEKGLTALSFHPFDNHKECDQLWCHHKRDPARKFTSLPYGRPLENKALQQDLEGIFNKLKKHSQKLANLGSTQPNESFNKTVASKAPKNRLFSRTITYRVAASVAQKNIGQGYLVQVNKKIGISPGTYTRRLAALKDRINRRKKAMSITKEAKRKRLHLKAERKQMTAAREIREGPTYCSEIALQTPTGIGEIPPPLSKPSFQPIENLGIYQHVYFDLETTGLARSSHITQIAAVCGSDRFSQYILPKIPITDKATEVTGLRVMDGKMFHGDKEVDAVYLVAAIDALLNFFTKFQSKVVFVGHNVKSFDCHIFLNSLQNCGKTQEIGNCVAGFVDTKQLFKVFDSKVGSFSLENLYKRYVCEPYKAHDALEDVLALQKLVTSVGVDLTDPKYLSSSFTFSNAVDSHSYSLEVRKNLPSLEHLISEKIVSRHIANRIAGSGLCFSFLQLVYNRDSKDGIYNLFSDNVKKAPRVTKSLKICSSLNKYFSSSCES
uniref:Exonuclease domain-containing protein n=1 Tax=Magallana gigas TaxID=29159 RepID=A0A8W8JFW7_MAGGI